MSDDRTDDYHATMVEALTKTVFEASLIDLDGKKTAYVRTAEACEALISVIGMLLEGAPNCRTPQGMRKMSEAVGRNTLLAMESGETGARGQRRRHPGRGGSHKLMPAVSIVRKI